MTDTTYKTSCNQDYSEGSKRHNETNDCTVRAMAAATGSGYDAAHAALAKHGRPHRKGPPAKIATRVLKWRSGGTSGRRVIVVPAMEKSAEDLGFELRVVPRDEYRAKTMITAERDRNLAKGRYIAMVRGHVAAIVDGQVIDWTVGRRHRIKEVYELTRKANQGQSQATTRQPMKRMSGFNQRSLF